MGRTCRANASYHFAVLTNICMCTCVRVCTGAYTRSRAKRRLDQVICPAYHTTHASLLFLTETYRCLGGGGPLPETSSRTQRSQRPRSDGVCFFQGIIPSIQPTSHCTPVTTEEGHAWVTYYMISVISAPLPRGSP
jgi:hypothetical protein